MRFSRLGDARSAVCGSGSESVSTRETKQRRGRERRTVRVDGTLDHGVGLVLRVGVTARAVLALALDDVLLLQAVELVLLELVLCFPERLGMGQRPGSRERRSRRR